MEHKIDIRQLFSPTRGQIVFTSLGLLLYFMYQSFHEKIFGIQQTLANTVIYISDVISILLICTLSAVGSRFIVKKYNLNTKPSASEIIRNNTKQLVLSILFSIFVVNFIFIPVFYINNAAEFVTDILTANLYSVPFIIIYYFIDYSRRAISNYQELLINIDKLEKEKLDTELQILRAQFNPHFIFNAINTIYFQIENNNTNDISVLHHFKQMINYLTNVCTDEHVSIDQEIDYVKSYIEIQLLRKGDELESSILIDRIPNNFIISPFILQPFIENAFKYVSGAMELNIRLKLSANKLFYKITNSVDLEYLNMSEKKGLGLANLQKRLSQFYPNRHYFNCRLQKDVFIAEMVLDLEKN